VLLPEAVPDASRAPAITILERTAGSFEANHVSDELQRLDRLLPQLLRVLDAPGEDDQGSAESVWQKLDVLYKSMGDDALRALLRRQGMGSGSIDDALDVLVRRRAAMS